MKTIDFILSSIDKMQELQIPVNIEVGTFKVQSNGHLINWAGRQGEYRNSIISFKIVFRPDHIQTLFDLGVSIDLNNCVMAGLSPKAKRFKAGREAIKQGKYAPYYYMGDPGNRQTGVIENWLQADAKCTYNTLKILDKYCRYNHSDCISIDNDFTLANAGWKFKTKYNSFISYSDQSPIFINRLRRNAQGKKDSELLPIEKMALNKI